MPHSNRDTDPTNQRHATLGYYGGVTIAPGRGEGFLAGGGYQQQPDYQHAGYQLGQNYQQQRQHSPSYHSPLQHHHHHHHHRQHLQQQQQHHDHHLQYSYYQPNQTHNSYHLGAVVRPGRPVEANQRPVASDLESDGPYVTDHSTSSSSNASTLIQVAIAFLIAGFGNVGAGIILDHVKEWPVFLHVDELFILVPSLLGLKGNLEMTMASRLSTQANLGNMNNAGELLKMAKGNLVLVQCQATVVSFVVAVFASLVKAMTLQSVHMVGGGGPSPASASPPSFELDSPRHLLLKNATANELVAGTLETTGANLPSSALVSVEHISLGGGGGGGAVGEAGFFVDGFDWHNALILVASSMLTANIACFVLGTMMILVIVGSHRCRIDPDNIAAPVAASLGDMTTAALLAVIAHSIYHYSEQQRLPYLALVITLLFLGMLPVWVRAAKSNPYTADVITKGWTPIVIAVFISSCGGFILEYGKSHFSRLPLFQPVINGVGGNLVAVQASRLSTSLHKSAKIGQLPPESKLLMGPLEVFYSRKNDTNTTTARLLVLMSIPAHLLYFFVIRLVEGENAAQLTAIFLGFYMLLAVLQVAILLYLAQNLVSLLWRLSIDPDNYSTPLLTALGDLLGCAFLLVVFVIAYHFNDPTALTIV